MTDTAKDARLVDECRRYLRQLDKQRQSAALMQRLLDENEALRAGVAEAMEWNWLDEDAPEHVRDRLERICK